MQEKLLELKMAIERLQKAEISTRIRESELLGEEFDYLEIDDKGLLKDPYPIVDSDSYTFDKVLAAGIIRGMQYKKETNGELGMIPYYEGRNEINKIVGRKPLYTEIDFALEKERIEKHLEEKGNRKL